MNRKKIIIFSAIVIISTCICVASVCIWLILRNKDANKMRKVDYASITFEVVDDSFSAEDFKNTVNIIERRAYELDSNAIVLKDGTNRVIVKVPCNSEAIYMLEEIGKKGEIQFITDLGNAQKEKVWLDGNCIKKAKASIYTAETGKTEYILSLEFTEYAKEKFAEATAENIGKVMYIVYNGEVISQPVITQKISGGEVTINGMNTLEEAEELASILTIGTLKLELKVVSKDEGEENDKEK